VTKNSNITWIKSPTTSHWSVRFKTAFGIRTISTGTAVKADARKLVKSIKLEDRVAHRFERKVCAAFATGSNVKNEATIKAWRKQRELSGKAERTLDHHCTYVRAFLRYAGLENESPAAITAEHVYGWINKRDGTKATNRVRRLIIITDYLDYCESNGLSIGNPARTVKTINYSILTHEQKERGRKKPLTLEQVNHLVAYIRNEMRELQEEIDLRTSIDPPSSVQVRNRLSNLQFWLAAVIIARHTAYRIGDICNMEKASITPDSIVVHAEKTSRRVEVPLNEELRLILSSVPENNTRWLFPHQCALQRSPSRPELWKQFKKLLDGAGIEGVSFHSLRSTALLDAVERLKAAGKSEEEAVAMAARMAGHSGTETTKKHYL